MDRSSSWYEDSEETEQRRTIMNYHSGGAADGALFAPLLENEASTYFNEPILGSVSPIETSAFGNQYQLWETGLTERVLQPVDSSHLATPRSMHMQQSMGIFDRTQEVLQVVGATYNDYTTDQRSVGLVLRGSSTIAPRDMHLGGHERLFTAPTRSTTDGMHMEDLHDRTVEQLVSQNDDPLEAIATTPGSLPSHPPAAEPYHDVKFASKDSYAWEVFEILRHKSTHGVALRDLYKLMCHINHPHCDKNGIRHNLSQNKGFELMRQEGTNRKLSKWQVTKYALKQGGVEPTTRDRKSPAKRNVLDDKDKEKARAGRLGGKASSRNRINRSGAIEEPQVAAVVHSTLPALSSPNRSSINTSVNSSAFIRRTTNDHDFNMELLDSFNSGATSAGFDAFNSISIYHFDSSSQ